MCVCTHANRCVSAHGTITLKYIHTHTHRDGSINRDDFLAPLLFI